MSLMNGINKHVCLGNIQGVGYKYIAIMSKGNYWFRCDVDTMEAFCFWDHNGKVWQGIKEFDLGKQMYILDEFIDYLKPKLQHFVKHNFEACNGKINNSTTISSLFQPTQWCPLSILLKIIGLKCKMRCRVCIGIHIRYQFSYIFVSVIIPY